MSTKPAEILLFDYLAETIGAAQHGDILFELELHDTTYQKIKTGRGIRISDAVGSMAPDAGGGLKEFDVVLTLACYSRVEGRQQTERQAALLSCFELQQEIVRVLLASSSFNDRVCESVIGKCARGYDSLDGNPFAVANISLVINPSGEFNAGRY